MLELKESLLIFLKMTRDALVVGINNYKYEGLPNLQAPARDAEAIARYLEDYGEFNLVRRFPEALDSDTKKPIVGKTLEVSLTELKKALIQLFKPDSQQIPDTALFYFSGHGLIDNEGIKEGFLATSDVFPNVSFNGLSLQWLRRLLQESPVKQQIIWLDCCYAGAFLDFNEANPGEKGNARDRCFIAGARDFERAYEDLTEPYSAFTKVLLQGLDPQRCPQQWITNINLVDFINQNIGNLTQKPIYSNFGESINLTRTWDTQTTTITQTTADICPYKGLAYFDNNDQDPQFFYGRRKLTDELIDKVRQSNFIALLGASGSGKSSVLRAGLLHQLQLGRLQLGNELGASNQWQFLIFSPGEDPLANLAKPWLDHNLSGIDRATQLDQIESLLKQGADGLRKLVEASPKPRIILLVDQFEEVFTLCQDEQKRTAFLDCILGALSKTEKLCLILAVRVDFLGKCLEKEYSGLGKYIQEHLITVPPMTSEELAETIVKPAEKVNLLVEDALIEQMLTDVVNAPGSLPLLQYTLTQLWEKRRLIEQLDPPQFPLKRGTFGAIIELATYTKLGGIGGTLNKRATEVYNRLQQQEQVIAKHIFLNLTQLGENTEDTRRRVRKQDLITAKYPEDLLSPVIQTLANEKLIITSEQVAKDKSKSREVILDVPHEALIRHWLLLREWLDKNRIDILKQREIETYAHKWREQGRKVDYLLQGNRLKEGRDFSKNQGDNYPLSTQALDFIERSHKYQRKKRFQGVGLFLIIPLIGTIVAGYFGFREYQLNGYRKLISDCTGKRQCLGRIEALESLVKAKRNLNYADLEGAFLYYADLRGAKLRGANLRGANLRGANLRGANLRGANLEGAFLNSAHLEGAFLHFAHLEGAFLHFAHLEGAKLEGAFLQSAFLNSAHLEGARLKGANLQSANLNNARNLNLAQIKSACNWEKGIYKGIYEKFEFVVDEAGNKVYIEQLKQDKASDPKEPVDCSVSRLLFPL